MKLSFRPAIFLLLVAINLPATAIEIVRHSFGIEPDVQWQTNHNSATWSDPQAITGGHVHLLLPDFPPHLRRIGPDTPHTASGLLHSLQVPLLGEHPQTGAWLPMLASHWRYEPEQNILYFNIDKNARWSDGRPVSNDDIAFTIRFLLDPAQQTGWQRQRLQQQISKLELFGSHRFALHLRSAQPEALAEIIAMRPLAAHYYQQNGWPTDLNWSAEPVTGPYRIIQIKHNQSLTLQRNNRWWGWENRYFRHRFNASRITLLQVTDKQQIAPMLQRAELDLLSFGSSATQHGGLNRLHEQLRLVLTTLRRQQPKIDSLLLLNPVHSALNSPQAREKLINQQTSETAAELLYNDNESLKRWNLNLPARQMEPQQLLQRVRSGQFDLALLSFMQPVNVAQLEASSGQLLPPALAGGYSLNTLIQENLLRLGLQPADHYSLHWPWLNIPDNELLSWLSDPFEPFDAVSGGLFWVDRKLRTEVLANPQRKPRETPTFQFIGPAASAAGLPTPIPTNKD